jgi:hypothetical protein
MRSTAIIIILVLMSGALCAQSFSEKITRDLAFEKKAPGNTLIVSNINGSITVTGYDGDRILIEAAKNIRAKTDERLEKGKKIQPGVVDLADTLILFVDGLCQKFEKHGQQRLNKRAAWGYHSKDECRNCHDEFEYTMNFTIKVPFDVHLIVGTINNGDVSVENMRGVVVADNINGSIRLQRLQGGTEASTINGNLDVEYTYNPTKYCRYYTLNGDINASFQKGLAANLSFESFNGSLYTNIDKIDALPAVVEQHKEGNGIRYKIGDNRYRVGAGGILLDFETFNGDVYLKEKTN